MQKHWSFNNHSKKTLVHRLIRTVFQTVISVEAIMTISIKLKKTKLFKNWNYNFFSKNNRQLDSEKKNFAHIIHVKIKTVQIKNVSNKLFIISKNFKIDLFRDYTKKNCFLITSKNRHLIISSAQKLDLKKIFKKSIIKNSKKLFMKTIMLNEITIYENSETIKNKIAITKKTSQIWNSIFKIINFSSKRWMKIKISDYFSKFAKVFRISSKNKTFIDKKFDALHVQNKMKWSTKSISYAFSVFVVWYTMHLQDKASLRKNWIIVDIKKFNKIFEFNTYFMSLQSDMISCLQKCKFISIINCASFFYQWKVAKKNYINSR